MKKTELQQIIREEILKELFDTKEPVKWKADGDDDEADYSATFTGPNDRKYVINMQFLGYLNLPDEAIIASGNLLPDEVNDLFFDQGYHVEFGDTKEGKGITGLAGPEASKVFGIVLNAIIGKIKRQKIDYIFFSAKEPSRKALYKKMAPLIASKLGMKQVNDGEYYFLYKE